MRTYALVGCCFLAFAPLARAAPKSAPWLAQVAARPTPQLDGDVPAYVLFSETVVTVAADGNVTERRRHALRVLTQKGDDHAIAFLPYVEKKDKLVSGTAWLVRDGKTVKSESLNKWFDVCVVTDGTVFTEHRNRMMSFPRETLARDVFGYETTAMRPLLFPQLSVDFPVGVPTGIERFEVILPKGWTLAYVARGKDLPQPEIDPARNSWAWEMREVRHLPAEEWTPRVATDAPRVFVTLVPPADARKLQLPRMDSWGDVGAWVESLGAEQCDRDANLVETAQRLAASSSEPLAPIRAIAEHVQQLRYVAVDNKLGLGFGFKPRKATEVLARGYGDCKDKANLLRALLREVGITAHVVAIESKQRHPLVEEWPSVTQFNHVISAIEVDASVDLPFVITTDDGRRLLLFDPTDEFTVLGDLHWSLQGATGLLLGGSASVLIAVPELLADRGWRYVTEAQLTIAPNGTASGRFALTGQRQGGRGLRGALRHLSARQISERASRYMNSLLRGVVVRDPAIADDRLSGDIVFSFALDAPGVLQPAPGGLFIMRLDVFNRDTVPQLSSKPRVQPLEIPPIVHDEIVNFTLPPGLVVDDAPADVREESRYGIYERKLEISEGAIVLRRSLQFRPQILSASDYPEVRAFLTAATRADKAAIVLRHAP